MSDRYIDGHDTLSWPTHARKALRHLRGDHADDFYDLCYGCEAKALRERVAELEGANRVNEQ